jgi:radical SAM superfamily enzyme YgiQ (UPF0313 family)
VLEKAWHIDQQDLLPSAKLGSKDVALFSEVARLSGGCIIRCGFCMMTNLTPMFYIHKSVVNTKIVALTAYLPIPVQEK